MTNQDSAYQIGAHPPVNQNQMLLARASAIQAYAALEFSLCILFSLLLGIDIDRAGLVFFRITNTHSRNRILDDLREKKFGESYKSFWNSMMSIVRTLDQRRNEIVHWHVVQTIDLTLPHAQAAKLSLQPPAGWSSGSPASIADQELVEFMERCSFASTLLSMFGMVTMQSNFPESSRAPWLQIFEQPVAYPPPDTHPLSPNYKAPEVPPQPSGA
jgi:hypothetical protein